MNPWDIVSWLANGSILISAILIGKKKKSGFLFTSAGNSTYAIKAITPGHFDLALAFICLVFTIIQLYNWNKWRKEEKIKLKAAS